MTERHSTRARGIPFTVKGLQKFARDYSKLTTAKRIQEGGDTKGFGVQLTPAGKMTLALQYRKDGKRRFEKLSRAINPIKASDKELGQWLRNARKRGEEARVLIDEGVDPKIEAKRMKAEKLRQRELGTARQLFRVYFAKRDRESSDTHKDRQSYDNDIKPLIENTLARDIGPEVVVESISRPMGRNKGHPTRDGRGAAGTLWMLWRAAFSYGLTFDNDPEARAYHPKLRFELENNVVSRVKSPATQRSRERYLDVNEIPVVWKAWSEDKDIVAATCAKLLLMTGARMSEISHLSWKEVGQTEILIPGERTKTSKPLALPLTTPMKNLLDTCDWDPDWVFPSKSYHARKNQGLTSCRMYQLSLRVAEKLEEHCTTHDLRRTFKSHMARLRVPMEIAHRLQNHVFPGVGDAVYNRHGYFEEKLDALNRWHRELDGLTSDSKRNVVPLREATA